MKRRRALISVSEKEGVDAFARELAERGWEILSTGGTARALRDAGIPVTEVREVTGHPEMMEGRVKTLHPAIHAGLLARRDREDDLEALEAQGYGPVDLVAVNLYPFVETIRGGGVSADEAMEQVDIGGPTLLRAAAKNHRWVWAVVDPDDYGRVLDALDDGAEAEGLRRELAGKVFRHVGSYDHAIGGWLGLGAETREPEEPGEREVLRLERIQPLRYGENPDQRAAFYAPEGPFRTGVPSLRQLHGKELSYNNILDLDGALLALAPFAFAPRPAVAILKHTTPCGLALGDSVVEAYRKALATDPMSAFGSVVASTVPVDGEAADAMAELFVECLVAPSFSQEALERLTRKKNLRLLVHPEEADGPVDRLPAEWRQLLDGAAAAPATAAFLALYGRRPAPRVSRSVYGGMLVQTPPVPPFYRPGEEGAWKVVTERAPDPKEWNDLRFAWAAVFSVKSNAILLARDGGTVGIGAGQMSRVDASRIAVRKAGDAELDTAGAVLASDAFFPFRDGVDAAAEAGIVAMVQPGGSIRDEEVIQAADEHGLAMVFTGRRLFRH